MSIIEAQHELAELSSPALFLGRRARGTIARACDQLHLTQPSISKQLRQLDVPSAASKETGRPRSVLGPQRGDAIFQRRMGHEQQIEP